MGVGREEGEMGEAGEGSRENGGTLRRSPVPSSAQSQALGLHGGCRVRRGSCWSTHSLEGLGW